MIVLTGGAGVELCEVIADRAAQGKRDIGQLFGPRALGSTQTLKNLRCPYALDNDAFGAWKRGDVGWWQREGERLWRGMLEKMPTTNLPYFAILPDVVGDWKATIVRAKLYRRELEQKRLPVALALQDGCDFDEAIDFAPEWVFVGGTTRWKWENLPDIAAKFQSANIKIHVGRTGGRERIRECLRLDIDSCDSTAFSRFWKIDMNWLPDELDACDAEKCQGQLYLNLR